MNKDTLIWLDWIGLDATRCLHWMLLWTMWAVPLPKNGDFSSTRELHLDARFRFLVNYTTCPLPIIQF